MFMYSYLVTTNKTRNMPNRMEIIPSVIKLVMDMKSTRRASMKCCLEFIIKHKAAPFIRI